MGERQKSEYSPYEHPSHDAIVRSILDKDRVPPFTRAIPVRMTANHLAVHPARTAEFARRVVERARTVVDSDVAVKLRTVINVDVFHFGLGVSVFSWHGVQLIVQETADEVGE